MTHPAVDRELAQVGTLLEHLDRTVLHGIVEVLEQARRTDRTVFVAGNGGSAATAAHFATDLAHTGGHPMRVLCLGESTSQLTATANDQGYERVFARPLAAWMRPGDVLVGFSVSGRSPSCVAAFEHARAGGAVTIGMLGGGDGPLRSLADLALVVPSEEPRPVESVHLAAAHAIAGAMGA